jgi:hypothetical protein
MRRGYREWKDLKANLIPEKLSYHENAVDLSGIRASVAWIGTTPTLSGSYRPVNPFKENMTGFGDFPNR